MPTSNQCTSASHAINTRPKTSQNPYSDKKICLYEHLVAVLLAQLTLISILTGSQAQTASLSMISKPVEASSIASVSTAEHSINPSDTILPLAKVIVESSTSNYFENTNKVQVITSSADSVNGIFAEFLDKNFLHSDFSDTIHEATNGFNSHPNEIEDLMTAKTKSNHKTFELSQQQQQQISDADWWTKLAPPKATTAGKQTQPPTKPTTASKVNKQPTKPNRKTFSSSTSSTFYKEQPTTTQNPLIILENQLFAIKNKHKLLVTKSIRQLHHLDTKLIDSYKLCFKKKMPLYAGMLYRTRDFVIRMAKDVKHERKVLEAMARQVQGVLKQRIGNKTLVREYNQLTSSKFHHQQQTSTETSVSKFEADDQSHIVQKTFRQTVLTKSVGQNRIKKDSFYNVNQMQENVQQERQSLDSDSQTSFANKPTQITATTKGGRKSINSAKNGLDNQDVDASYVTTRKPKTAVKFTVSINEVNLKKELAKTQALIDRIDVSTRELSSVADEIVFLAKFNDNPKKSFTKFSKINQSNIQSHLSSPVEQKKAKKSNKSPIKVFLERYGRLTVPNAETPNDSSNATATTSTTISEIISNMSPSSTGSSNSSAIDMKPLFDSASLSYSELDSELGFDELVSAAAGPDE